MLRHAAALLATLLLPLSALAQGAGPLGVWQTIDDDTGKPRALVRIADEGGGLRGTIERLFREPGEEPDPRCTACTDARKDQPIVGMTILRNLHPAGEANVWDGGEILDPANGKTYKSRLTLESDGSLSVRGYVGMPMLGRTQRWVRP